jgi:hypothetical protein
MTVASVANLWPAQLAPVASSDLTAYMDAIAGMWGQCDAFLADPDNDIVDFQALFDVDLAPFWVLAWQAQCVGERIPVGYTDAQARDWIRNSPTWVRGTPQGIWNAVKRVLAPGASMQMRERWNPNTSAADPDWISILTWATQTPDQNLVLAVLRRNVPADIMFGYTVQAAATWGSFTSVVANWGALRTTYGPNWSNVQGATPGYVTWS